MTEVPNPPEEDLKRMTLAMHREGKSQRTIAKAVGRPLTAVHRWIAEDAATRSKGGRP